MSRVSGLSRATLVVTVLLARAMGLPADRTRMVVQAALLAINYFLGCTVLFAHVTLTSIVARGLPGGVVLSTLPMGAYIGASALVIVPSGLVMARIGYKPVFYIAVTIGLLGSLISVVAVLPALEGLRLPLLTIAMVPQGLAYGVVHFYRHVAAVEVSDDAVRPYAVAIALTGGVLSGTAGPGIAQLTVDLFNPGFLPAYVLFYATISAVYVIHLLVLVLTPVSVTCESDEVMVSTTVAEEAEDDLAPSFPLVASSPMPPPPRELWRIAMQADFVGTLLATLAAHGGMVFAMGSVPLVMRSLGFGITSISFVVQLHVVAMYMPSLLTGLLARRGSARVVIAGGIGLLAVGYALFAWPELVRDRWYLFLAPLTLVGVGWNLVFVSATTFLASLYRPSEKFKTQSVFDASVFGVATVINFLIGVLLHYVSWDILFVVAGAMVLVAGFFASAFFLAARLYALRTS